MKKLFNIFSIGLLLAGMASCSEEFPAENKIETNSRTILIELPYTEQQTATRATPLGNAIRTLDILAFDEQGRYLYTSESAPLYSIDNGHNYLYTIDIQKKEEAAKQSFVFIANMREKVKTVCAASEGKYKNEIVPQLTFDNCNWNTSSTGLPMWSETSTSYDITTSAGVLDKIKMLRSVAAIEVLINGDLNEVHGLDYFKLSDIQPVDFHSIGYAAPSTGNYSWENDRYIISRPSVPEGNSPYDGYLISADAPSNSIQGKLFVPEFDLNKAQEGNIPSVLIAGYYGKGNSSKKTWYKVNLVKNGEPVDILRNYRYVLNITNVSSEGFTTPEEAYDNPSQNIRATLNMTYDSASDLNYIIYDAANYLAASAASLQLKGSQASTFDLLTNYSGGWNLTSVPDWINVSASGGPANQRSSISLSSKNPSDQLRSGTLEIQAGTLTMQISVNEVKSNEITYITATAQRIIGADELGVPASEFKLADGVAFHENYLYIANTYFKIENGKYTKRPALFVYDLSENKVVHKIEEWTHNGNTLNFEGDAKWSDGITDIAVDETDHRLYVMRAQSCVEVFDISNPAEPTYVTRIGKLLNSTDNRTTFRHSSAVGICKRAVLIRAANVLNTYERNTITSENWSNIVSKTSDNRNMLRLEYKLRQFALDPVTERLWLTEYGNGTFKGIYLLDVNRMNNFGNKEYQYCDLRERNVPLDYHPTGMAITSGKVYLTKENSTIDIFDRSILYGTSSRKMAGSEENLTPIMRASVENYQFGSMSKLYTVDEKDETFWTCDLKKNNLVLIQIGTGTIIM